MKIGIVGLGYWGKIILSNLERMNYKDIRLCDVSFKEENEFSNYKTYTDYHNLECDYVFITTPTSTHFKVCKYFLENDINVFCEKPLTTSEEQAKNLYSIALNNNLILFTDWIFTFNSHVETIKRDYDNGKLGDIRSITLNRLNLGPERFDVNARWDLASHDVSVIQYLFSEIPKKIRWIDYKRDEKSKKEDSCLGLIEYGNFIVTINASWKYRKKVRECVFEFDNYLITWDDYKKFLQYEDASNIKFPVYSGNLSYPCNSYEEPLKMSIKTFFSFNKDDLLEQKQLTIETIKILEGKTNL